MNLRISEVIFVNMGPVSPHGAPLGTMGLVLHLPDLLWIESAFVVNNLVCKHTKEMGSIFISVTPIPYCDVQLLLIYCKIYT